MNEPELRALLSAVQQGSLDVDAALSRLRAQPAPKPAETSAEGPDEFARIREIAELFAGKHTDVQTDIGDDAAVLRPQSRPIALSVDVAVEGVHIDLALLSYAQAGERAMTAAVSDLAAMGARPLAALSSLIAPRGLPHADFVALHTGIARAARDYGCPVVGGNLSSGAQLSLTTTVVGSIPGPGLLRAGARPGDAVYVTGPLGGAALGLRLLQLGAADQSPELVRAWRTPRARLAEGLALSGVASSAIDISDGALADLGHICEASGLGAIIEAARVPLAPGLAELSRAMGIDPLTFALTGGEDYELLYTLPAGFDDPCAGTRIGTMQSAPGPVRVLDGAGAELSLRDATAAVPNATGYRHF